MTCKTKVRAEKLHSCRVSHGEKEDWRTVLIDNDKVRTMHCSNICPWKCKTSQRAKKSHIWGSCFTKDMGRICSKYSQRRWHVLRWVTMFYLQPCQLHELLNAIICSGLVVWELLSRRSCWKASRAAPNLLSGTRRWQFTDYALLCAPTTPNNTKGTLLSCLPNIWLKISLSTCTTSGPVWFTLLLSRGGAQIWICEGNITQCQEFPHSSYSSFSCSCGTVQNCSAARAPRGIQLCNT